MTLTQWRSPPSLSSAFSPLFLFLMFSLRFFELLSFFFLRVVPPCVGAECSRVITAYDPFRKCWRGGKRERAFSRSNAARWVVRRFRAFSAVVLNLFR